ncbi:MAG: hypothetical protein AB8G22_00995 [Saprospiraceae bacterium]
MNILSKLTLLTLFFVCSNFTIAEPPSFDPHYELFRWNQDGVLFVRLKTQENRIRLLQESGESLAAKELEYERRQYHRYIRESFREHYNFTQVYFFFNRDAYRVLTGDYQNALFDVNGYKVRQLPDYDAIYLLDSYFPNHPHFDHHREEQAGFIIKKVTKTGVAHRISPTLPYTFYAPTQMKSMPQVRRFQKRVKEFNKMLWKRLAIAKTKVAEQQDDILVKEN